jgi:hypothetical protein
MVHSDLLERSDAERGSEITEQRVGRLLFGTSAQRSAHGSCQHLILEFHTYNRFVKLVCDKDRK